jgi:hypothetical protein
MDHPEIANDTSFGSSYKLEIQLRNGALTPEQRIAFHTAVINATRMLRMQLMFALPDQKLGKVTLDRVSSASGKKPVPFFEEE